VLAHKKRNIGKLIRIEGLFRRRKGDINDQFLVAIIGAILCDFNSINLS
jgi:hypothetical protein